MHDSLFLTLTSRKFIVEAALLMELNQTKEAKEIIDIVQNRELTSLSYNKSKTITTEIYVNVNEIQFARIFSPLLCLTNQ